MRLSRSAMLAAGGRKIAAGRDHLLDCLLGKKASTRSGRDRSVFPKGGGYLLSAPDTACRGRTVWARPSAALRARGAHVRRASPSHLATSQVAVHPEDERVISGIFYYIVPRFPFRGPPRLSHRAVRRGRASCLYAVPTAAASRPHCLIVPSGPMPPAPHRQPSRPVPEQGRDGAAADAPLPKNVGLVHDWLPVYAGAERVLEQMIAVFPEAELYSLIDVIPEGQRDFLQGKPVETSFLQHFPFVARAYRYYLPFAPLAIEQFDLSDHEIVVSSSYAVAKGALTRADQLHVSYVHSPMRYAWDLYHDDVRAEGVGERLRNLLARPLLHYMRLYDVQTAPRADVFVANSQHVARRIWNTYRRRAHVVYPPVEVRRFSLQPEKNDYFLTTSRLVSCKRVDLIVQAFNEMPDRELVVIGDGPQLERLHR